MRVLHKGKLVSSESNLLSPECQLLSAYLIVLSVYSRRYSHRACSLFPARCHCLKGPELLGVVALLVALPWCPELLGVVALLVALPQGPELLGVVA